MNNTVFIAKQIEKETLHIANLSEQYRKDVANDKCPSPKLYRDRNRITARVKALPAMYDELIAAATLDRQKAAVTAAQDLLG